MSTFTHVDTYSIFTCDCGVSYALSDGFIRNRKETRQGFYCPNGCPRIFTGATEAQKLQKELERERVRRESAERQTKYESARADTLEYRRRAAVAQTTKLKKRIAAGVCPCCQRTFQNLARHMASQHPEVADHEGSGRGQ